MVNAKVSVAKLLEQQIAISDKSQKEIAEIIGYTKPNIMTMFKTGRTKLPINKVGALAKALNLDSAYLLKLVLSEYSPETWDAIEGILGEEKLIGTAELNLLKLAREATGNVFPDVSIKENRDILVDAFKRASMRDQDKAQASVDRYNKLPRNARKSG